jgi:hypothetical protein
MMSQEDVHFQLIDLPAVATEHPVPWLVNTLQTADAALLVVDIGEAACLEQLQTVQAELEKRRVTLTERWTTKADAHASAVDQDEDPFALRLPTLMLANKAEDIGDLEAELHALRELTGLPFPLFAVSATTGRGLGEIGPWLFTNLGVVRVYTKIPGHSADKQRPFTLRTGQTVGDVARLVHQDLGRSVRYARVWGHSGFDGQHVGPEHVVVDGDVVELHA